MAPSCSWMLRSGPNLRMFSCVSWYYRRRRQIQGGPEDLSCLGLPCLEQNRVVLALLSPSRLCASLFCFPRLTGGIRSSPNSSLPERREEGIGCCAQVSAGECSSSRVPRAGTVPTCLCACSRACDLSSTLGPQTWRAGTAVCNSG